MDDNLDLLKQFESNLKVFLLEKYGTYLPSDKISLLNTKNYITEEIKNGNKTMNELKVDISRNILSDLINMKTQKDIVLDNGNIISIPYGEDIELGLIEYYLNIIKEKYNLDINLTSELKNDLAFVSELNKRLIGSIDSKAFLEDAIKLLNNDELKSIVPKYDSYELKKFYEKNKRTTENNNNKENEKKVIKDVTKKEGSLQTIWINDRKNIKYIDRDGKVHLIDIEDSKKAQEYYDKVISSLAPNEKMDQDAFFNELKKIVDETKLTETKDVKNDELNYEEMDMFSFIESNKEIKKQEKIDTITHSNEMNIHVVESNNDIIVTEDKLNHVESHVIKDNDILENDKQLQENIDFSSKLISKEDFMNLWERFYNGEELTREELESLRRAYSHYENEDNKNIENSHSKNSQVLSQKNKTYGFTDKKMTIYFSIMFIIAITIFLLYIFKK